MATQIVTIFILFDILQKRCAAKFHAEWSDREVTIFYMRSNYEKTYFQENHPFPRYRGDTGGRAPGTCLPACGRPGTCLPASGRAGTCLPACLPAGVILHGTRISLFVGISTVAISLVLGVLMGVAAGYYGGWIDMVIMRYIDLQWAFPNFIIAVYLVAVFGAGLTNVIIAIALAFLDDFARIARSMVLTLKESQYVDAARVMGASDWRIMCRHILPNATAPIIVQATVSVSYAILGEAGLSFLGLGVEADTPTWGLILSESRSFISRAWWLGVFPGLAIMITVLAINFVGDSLRDIMDVREGKDPTSE